MRWTPGGRSSDLEDRRGSSGGGFGGGRHADRPGRRRRPAGPEPRLQAELLRPAGRWRRTAASPTAAGPVASTPEEEKKVEFVSFVLDDAQETWAAPVPGPRPDLRARQAGALPRRDPVGLRLRRGGDRPVLLPGRRPRSTSTWASTTSCSSASARPATSRRPTCSPTSSATTSSACSARRPRCARQQQQPARRRQRALGPAGAAGRLLRRRLGPRDRSSGTSSIPATSTKGSVPPRRWATTGSSGCQGQGVHPEGFTHGSSEQRTSWFRRGFESGRPEDCDTFKS